MQRLSCNTAAVGLGQTAATSGGMYMVMLRDRWGNEHRLEAMAVPHIHTGPAARCPQNLRKQFLRTYMPLSGELHQAGGATDICVGADYPQLQPQHIEKEIGDGQLHVYRSAFGCGYILRGTAPAAISADAAKTAAAEVTARNIYPEPVAVLEVEVCVPEAARVEEDTNPPPMAAQVEPPREKEVPEVEGAAAAEKCENRPPTVASEPEEAAPAAGDGDSPAKVNPEDAAAPARADAGQPRTAAPGVQEGAGGVAPATEEAAPAAARQDPPPMAAPADEVDPEETADGEEESSLGTGKGRPTAVGLRGRQSALGLWTVMAMLAVTGTWCPGGASGFMARNGAGHPSRVDVYAPPEPAARLTTTLCPPSSGQAADVADRVGTEMECRALHSDEEKGGGYPIAALEKLVEGRYPPFNPGFLATDTDSHK